MSLIKSSKLLQAQTKKIATDLDSLNVLYGLMVSVGGIVALTHLSTWAEEAVSM